MPQLSHLQIHHPSFQDNYDIKYQINSLSEVLKALDTNKKVNSYSSRIVLSGMASTARGATGVKLIGADHINEKNITDIHDQIVKGTYFSGSTSRQAVIGQELAEKLKLDIKKSIYLTFVNENGLQERLKLKVVGIFKSGNSMFDSSHMFAKKDYLDKIFEKKDKIYMLLAEIYKLIGNKELSNKIITPYSDFLLHDMGPDLDDKVSEGDASSSEWKTPPLWGIGLVEKVNKHTRFLHDGRAKSIEEAIIWHGGEAENSKNKYLKLNKKDRNYLLKFLNSL